MSIDGWKIHRRIGMSRGLFTRAGAFRVYWYPADLQQSLDEVGALL